MSMREWLDVMTFTSNTGVLRTDEPRADTTLEKLQRAMEIIKSAPPMPQIIVHPYVPEGQCWCCPMILGPDVYLVGPRTARELVHRKAGEL